MEKFFSSVTRLIRRPFQDPRIAVLLGVVVVGVALLKAHTEDEDG